MALLIISTRNLFVRKESSGNPSKFQCNPIETNQRDVTLCEKVKQASYFNNSDRADNSNNEPFRLRSRGLGGERRMTSGEQLAICSLSIFTCGRRS